MAHKKELLCAPAHINGVTFLCIEKVTVWQRSNLPYYIDKDTLYLEVAIGIVTAAALSSISARS